MNTLRLSLLISSVVVIPTALVVGAGPVSAEPASTPFGSHVSACAQMHGFTGQHNPSHHRSATATHAMSGIHC